MVKFKRGCRAYLSTDYEELKQHDELIICNVIYDDDGIELIFAAVKEPNKKYLIHDHEINFLLISENDYFLLKDDSSEIVSNKAVNDKRKSVTSAKVIEKIVAVLEAYILVGNYKATKELFNKEKIKLSTLKKETIQHFVDMALDEKDYKLLKELYS